MLKHLWRPHTALVLALASTLGGAAHASDAPEVVVYQIVEIDLVRDAVDGFRTALTDAVPAATTSLKDAQGQANLFPTIARQIVRDAPDLIAVIGTPIVIATVEAAQRAGSDVPIVFIAMGDPVGAGIAASKSAPGGQATGTTDWIEPADSLDTLLRAVPGATRIGTVWDPSNQNGKVFHDALAEAVAARDLTFVDVSIASAGEVFLAARSLIGRVDAVLLGPDATVIQGLPAIGGIALEEKIPLVVTAGDPQTPGVFLGLGVDYGALGALAGGIAAQILGGADPGDIAIVGMDEFAITLN
ncbi:MAG: ABC transporter substrate-binding protein, partial [Pseudomonadota bacterium]